MPTQQLSASVTADGSLQPRGATGYHRTSAHRCQPKGPSNAHAVRGSVVIVRTRAYPRGTALGRGARESTGQVMERDTTASVLDDHYRGGNSWIADKLPLRFVFARLYFWAVSNCTNASPCKSF
ncbi:uncharacterized protein [Dermacentor albipictus]|uniref:uncharacterized protein n=1 Tax=Dermacentor albipictus TaxID=60249 RepID=UPI0038FCC31A